MAHPRPTPDPQVAEVGGARAGDDSDRCLYVGTQWEDDIIVDRRDADDFKEASRMIGRTLAVRT
jgi:hypothetical protein